MLIPVVVRASYKISTAEVVTLENLLGSNLPLLLFPEVRVMNRTSAADSVTVSGLTRTVFANQPDPDFDGTVTQTFLSSVAISNGQVQTLTGLANQLLGSDFGITTELTLTHAGPAAESAVTLVLTGLIESSVSPDAGTTINV